MSQRGADLSYILIPILLLSLKNWLSYTARHILYALLFAVQIPPNHVFIMYVYTILLYCTYNPIVLYLLSVTALQKDEGCFPSATVF